MASPPEPFARPLSRSLGSRVPAVAPIALGGFIPSITSGLDRFGVTCAFPPGEFPGVLLVFAGFPVSEVLRDLALGPGARATAWAGRRNLA